MKRFLLFSGDSYYPNGGWADFQGAFDTEAEAMEALEDIWHDWYQIVDTQNPESFKPDLLR